MIWLGRVISVVFGLVLLAVLVLVLSLLEANDTFLNPDFYAQELREADAYAFVLSDFPRAVFTDFRALDPKDISSDLTKNPLEVSGLSNEDIVGAFNRALPPQWVQGEVEATLDQFGRFATGERDEFELKIEARDRVMAAVDEIEGLLRKAHAFDTAYDEVVAPFVEDTAADKLPLGISVPPERLVEALRRTLPPEWLQAHVEEVLNELVAYLVGDHDSLDIRVPLADRAEVALEELKAILRESDAYGILYDEVVLPFLVDRLGDKVVLPAGAPIGSDELATAMRQVAPPEWVQQQVEAIIDDATPYLTGKVDSFTIEISIADNLRDARQSLVELAETRVRETAKSLPRCGAGLSASDTASFGARLLGGELPPCLPPGVSVAQVVDTVHPLAAGQLDRYVLAAVPATFTFSSDDLRRPLADADGGKNLERLDDARKLLREGWRYHEADLRYDIEHTLRGDPKALDRVREFLSEGWTYTQKDFWADLSKADGVDVGNVDRARGLFSTARAYAWVLYVPVILLLVVIGFLGGRGWTGRLAWASLFLMLSAGAIFLALGPAYDALSQSGVENLRAQMHEGLKWRAEFALSENLLVDKTAEVVASVAGRLASGIAASARGLFFLGLILFVISAGWGMAFGGGTKKPKKGRGVHVTWEMLP